jgi:prophage regulatory protein
MKEVNQEAATLLRLPAMLRRSGLSRSVALDLVKRGKFPKPVKISARCVAWIESEVESWIADRIAASRKVAS